ncbi:hypothetical protein Q787_08405 [Ornithobacterium rhinotracheale H06-030791]|uniref:Uncharacterized protein n=1 Tax=Ornithobacterium rhinotracheale (strain ATCC 51463 / DSM 15997 / CCUG 23171 / CIP 104009 / LMG 9086) TaxID=867902 RepID=I4A1R8_ORNRL|nr:hypothetical protein Ornrh_1748 [Ornithobacterium rhinotracheale DSM 15997]AIQ00620.1 hypothetical protein Q785_08590 [Ornithobacterium rhinotracheale ORT-UMN 88]KGB66209.1 hypothetical protein Q787_08405 [Ornithobacterium rhinotracheale H06-030791]
MAKTTLKKNGKYLKGNNIKLIKKVKLRKFFWNVYLEIKTLELWLIK